VVYGNEACGQMQELTSRVIDRAGDDLVNRHLGRLLQDMISFDAVYIEENFQMKSRTRGIGRGRKPNLVKGHDDLVFRPGQKLTCRFPFNC
jgi:hypothetical protein